MTSDRIKHVVDEYENDWRELSPIVYKLTKLAEFVNIEEKMVVSPEVALVIKK